MKKLWALMVVLYLLGALSGWALEAHHSSQVLRSAEISCIHEKISMDLYNLEFHSKTSLNALKTNSTGAFNISAMDMERDFGDISTRMSEATIYLYYGRRPTDSEITNLTDTSPCMRFIEASKEAIFNGEANISAVEKGLSLIQDFAVEWLSVGSYPSNEFLRANEKLQRECELLIREMGRVKPG